MALTENYDARLRPQQLRETFTPGNRVLSTIRSPELLELINTPEARKLIDEMSRSTGDPIQKRKALLTLKRVQEPRPTGQ